MGISQPKRLMLKLLRLFFTSSKRAENSSFRTRINTPSYSNEIGRASTLCKTIYRTKTERRTLSYPVRNLDIFWGGEAKETPSGSWSFLFVARIGTSPPFCPLLPSALISVPSLPPGTESLNLRGK